MHKSRQLPLTAKFNMALGNKDLRTQQKYLLNNKMASSTYLPLAGTDGKLAQVSTHISELNRCKPNASSNTNACSEA